MLGVDGCPGGWVVAAVSGDAVRWHTAPDTATVLMLAGPDQVGVDMPLGLAEASARACDTEARRWLGRAGSSVFPAPVRAVLGAVDYADACARSRAARGVAISKQTWFLVEKIRDWDDRLTPASRVAEVHPEIAFRLMAGVAELPPKKSAAGRDARLVALRSWLPDPVTTLAAAPRPARSDDALDALACAWSAQRVVAGTALAFGGNVVDSRGLPMGIQA